MRRTFLSAARTEHFRMPNNEGQFHWDRTWPSQCLRARWRKAKF